jgi:hypothetical protein
LSLEHDRSPLTETPGQAQDSHFHFQISAAHMTLDFLAFDLSRNADL